MWKDSGEYWKLSWTPKEDRVMYLVQWKFDQILVIDYDRTLVEIEGWWTHEACLLERRALPSDETNRFPAIGLDLVDGMRRTTGTEIPISQSSFTLYWLLPA